MIPPPGLSPGTASTEIQIHLFARIGRIQAAPVRDTCRRLATPVTLREHPRMHADDIRRTRTGQPGYRTKVIQWTNGDSGVTLVCGVADAGQIVHRFRRGCGEERRWWATKASSGPGPGRTRKTMKGYRSSGPLMSIFRPHAAVSDSPCARTGAR